MLVISLFYFSVTLGRAWNSVRKRKNIVLVRNGKQQEFQVSKPGFKRFRIFSEDLVGVELIKPSIILDKPIYLGAAILDLSKLLMYRFWYDTLKKRYNNIKLCMTDTDSVLFWVETENIYEDMWEMREKFDTSLITLRIASTSVWIERRFQGTSRMSAEVSLSWSLLEFGVKCIASW